MKHVFNMNDSVTVELTQTGREHYDAYWRSIIGGRHKDFYGDMLTVPLWELFQVFGTVFHNGMPRLPFKLNTITIEPEYEKAQPEESNMRTADSMLVHFAFNYPSGISACGIRGPHYDTNAVSAVTCPRCLMQLSVLANEAYNSVNKK